MHLVKPLKVLITKILLYIYNNNYLNLGNKRRSGKMIAQLYERPRKPITKLTLLDCSNFSFHGYHIIVCHLFLLKLIRILFRKLSQTKQVPGPKLPRGMSGANELAETNWPLNAKHFRETAVKRKNRSLSKMRRKTNVLERFIRQLRWPNCKRIYRVEKNKFF